MVAKGTQRHGCLSIHVFLWCPWLYWLLQGHSFEEQFTFALRQASHNLTQFLQNPPFHLQFVTIYLAESMETHGALSVSCSRLYIEKICLKLVTQLGPNVLAARFFFSSSKQQNCVCLNSKWSLVSISNSSISNSKRNQASWSGLKRSNFFPFPSTKYFFS